MSSKGTQNGQGNNQPQSSTNSSPIVQPGEGGDLNIPRLGAGASPIAQPGEGDSGGPQGGNAAPTQALDQAKAMGHDIQPAQAPPAPPQQPQTLAAARAAQREMPRQDLPFDPATVSIADMVRIQQQTARNRPVQSRYGNEAAESMFEKQVVDIPVTGKLDDWANERKNRSDLTLEPVDPLGFADQAAHLAFLEEHVIINIHESSAPDAENPVQLGINGRQVFIYRGQDTIVRRKYVEQLLRAKPQTIKTAVAKTNDGDIVNRTIKSSAMRYPFSMVRDDNQLGRPWMRKILSEG